MILISKCALDGTNFRFQVLAHNGTLLYKLVWTIPSGDLGAETIFLIRCLLETCMYNFVIFHNF